MTVFFCDGFETYGDKTTSEANVIARIADTDRLSYVQTNGGHTATGNAIIDDENTVGFAYEFPDLSGTRAEWFTYEFPDGTGRFANYKVACDASVPVFCVGWRLYNPTSITPAQNVTIWKCQTNSTGGGTELRIDSNGTDLTYTPTSGGATTVVGALTKGAWHYIEVEFKMTTSANGGYVKIYVDGSQVANLTSQNVVNFTFFSTWGWAIGCGASSNQSAGENFAIDDVYCMEIDGVDHAAPLGPSRVLLLKPNSEATPNDWSPSTGVDNTAVIDGQDWDTTTYVEAATTLDDDHYGLETVSGDAVHGLDVRVVCEAIDGTPNLHIGFDDGGTADEEDMGTIATGGEVQKRQFFETAPATGWTVGEVNSVEATQRMTE